MGSCSEETSGSLIISPDFSNKCNYSVNCVEDEEQSAVRGLLTVQPASKTVEVCVCGGGGD